MILNPKKRIENEAEEFKNRTGREWSNSDFVDNCNECNVKFTMIVRKHHCRVCGEVVCKNCSLNRVQIDKNKVIRACISCYEDDNTFFVGKNQAAADEDGGNGHEATAAESGEPQEKKKESTIKASYDSSDSEDETPSKNLLYDGHLCVVCFKSLNEKEIIASIKLSPDQSEENIVYFCSDHMPQYRSEIRDPSTSSFQEAGGDVSFERERASTVAIFSHKNKIGSPEKVFYGHTKSQYFLLHNPIIKIEDSDERVTQSLNDRSAPIAVILHGGYWKMKYGISNSAVESLAPFFLSQGIAVCEVEYRRVYAPSSGSLTSPTLISNSTSIKTDEDVGGWPETNNDIIAAIEKLYELCNERQSNSFYDTALVDKLPAPLSSKYKLATLDCSRMFLVGHSAGGCLALWISENVHKRSLPVIPIACVALAPVADLIEGFKRRISDDGDAVEKYMKMMYNENDDTTVEAYKAASPMSQLPLVLPTIIAIGANDVDVPGDMVEDFYWEAKRSAGEMYSNSIENKVFIPFSLKYLKLPNTDHYDIVNASHESWKKIFEELLEICPGLTEVPSNLAKIDEVALLSKAELEMIEAKKAEEVEDSSLKNEENLSTSPSTSKRQSVRITMPILQQTRSFTDNQSTHQPTPKAIDIASSSNIKESGDQNNSPVDEKRIKTKSLNLKKKVKQQQLQQQQLGEPLSETPAASAYKSVDYDSSDRFINLSFEQFQLRSSRDASSEIYSFPAPRKKDPTFSLNFTS